MIQILLRKKLGFREVKGFPYRSVHRCYFSQLSSSHVTSINHHLIICSAAQHTLLTQLLSLLFKCFSKHL